ncbi:hypothetical protein [Vibrio phage phiKT1028]|nr:hypothetical protein [Vibrio phage phiKT1028]
MTVIIGFRGNFMTDSKETVEDGGDYFGDRVKIIRAPDITPHYVKPDGEKVKPDMMAVCGSTAMIYRHSLDPKDWLDIFELKEFKPGRWKRDLIQISMVKGRSARIFYRIGEEFFEVDFRGNELIITEPLKYASAGSGAAIFESLSKAILGNVGVNAYDTLLVLKLLLTSNINPTIGGNIRVLFSEDQVVQEESAKLTPEGRQRLRVRYQENLHRLTGIPLPEAESEKPDSKAKKSKKKPKKKEPSKTK